jgi:hypothetical protein
LPPGEPGGKPAAPALCKTNCVDTGTAGTRFSRFLEPNMIARLLLAADDFLIFHEQTSPIEGARRMRMLHKFRKPN